VVAEVLEPEELLEEEDEGVLVETAPELIF